LLFQTSLGIDIEDNSVSFAYLKASFRGARLATHATYALEEESSQKENVDLLGRLVRDFLGKNGISPAGLFLGLPRNLAILRYVELPLAVKENLRDTLGYEMEKYVPFSADAIYFDYQVIAEDKDSGKLKLLIIAAKKEAVDPYINLAARIGVNISGIEIASTAMANYFCLDQGPDEVDTYAIVYLRDGHLELDLVKGGFLDYSRTVKEGEWGPELPSFISHELQKLKDSLEKPQGRLSTVLCGFDAKAKVVDHLKADEGLEIRLVDLSRRGIPSSTMIPAYGLALKGILRLPTDINLVPDGFRKRPKKTGRYTMLVLVCLVILLGIAWGGGMILFKQLHLSRLNAEIANLQAEFPRIERTKAECKKIEDHIDYLNVLHSGDVTVLNVIKELSQKIPKNAWVKTFTYSDGEVKIQGFAGSALELIPSLEGSPLFNNVTFLSQITRTKKGQELFRIGLEID